MNNPLIVDIHEPVRIAIALKELGIPVVRKGLKLGDYAFGNYLIERKSVQDLLNSIYSGRLYNQMYDLMNMEERQGALFVIGEIPPVCRWTKTSRGRRYKQMITKEERDTLEDRIIANLGLALTSFHLPVYQCITEKQFVKYLCSMYYKCNRKAKSLKPVKRKSQSIPEIKSDIFACIPNIGRRTADKLAGDFTVKDFVALTKKELMTISGIGEKTANSIIEVFSQ